MKGRPSIIQLWTRRVWPSAEGGDYLFVAQRRLFSAMCLLIGGLGTPAVAVINYWRGLEAPEIAALSVLGMLVIASIPFQIHERRPIKHVAFVTMSVLLLFLAVVAAAPGRSQATVYMIIAPVITCLIAGFRPSLLVAVVAAAAVAVHWRIGTLPFELALTIAVASVGLTLAVGVFQQEIERANGYLQRARAAATESAARQEESNRVLQATLRNIDQGVAVYGADQRLRVWNGNLEWLLDTPEIFAAPDAPTPAPDAPTPAPDAPPPAMRADQQFRRLAKTVIAAPDTDEAEIERMAQAFLAPFRSEGAGGRFQSVLRHRRTGRDLEWIGNPMPDGGVVYTVADVTETEEARRRVERAARMDGLTGLFNRGALAERLKAAAAEAAERGETLALCMVDLDRFKPVNDRYGHAAGDAVLRATATRLRRAVRETEDAFRFGGDEFALILRIRGGEPELREALERLLTQLKAPIGFDGIVVCVGASIGATLLDPASGAAPSPESLLRRADQALYEAKNGGRGCVRLHRPSAAPNAATSNA